MITHKIDKICELYFTLLKSNMHSETKLVLRSWLKVKTFLSKRENRGDKQLYFYINDTNKLWQQYSDDIEIEYCNYSAYKKLIKIQNEVFKN
jgi:hypothetical protein